MIQTIKHFAVNWTDGMKISERHFIAHDNFLTDTIRDSNSFRCNSINYGLLPIQFGKGEDETIFEVFSSATHDVQLTIKHCSALTAAGYRIEMMDYKTNIKSLMKTADGQESGINGVYYILISCNPFERVPFGDIDPEETPPRHPFTRVKYNVELLPESTLQSGSTGGNYIIIGKVNLKEGGAEADKDFIPPCTTTLSHPKLFSAFNAFAAAMANIQNYAKVILQKTTNTNQNTTLTSSVKQLCATIINHYSNVYFYYRNVVQHQPPAYMIEVFSSLALNVFNTIQLMPKVDMEEMLNYSFEWSEVAPRSLINQLSAVSEINYDHLKCGEHIAEVRMLLASLEMVLKTLSNLDYIGQRKENIIVNEKDITPAAKPKTGWSLLD